MGSILSVMFLWFLFGAVALVIANSKERSGCGWFIAGCLFGPFALVVAALPSLARDPNAPTPKTHVKCPDCAELIRIEARVCKHCGCKLAAGGVPDGKKQCPDCHRLNDAGEKYCTACGYNLTPT